MRQFWEPLEEGLAARSHCPAVFEKLDLLANRFTQAFYEKNWSGEFEPPVSDISIAEGLHGSRLNCRKKSPKRRGSGWI